MAMFRLVTPPTLLLTTALSAIFCAYAFLIGSIENSVPLLLGGVTAAIATYGTAMMHPWSRYLIYALTTGFIAKLALSLWQAADAGYFGFYFRGWQEALRALAPSLLLAGLSCVCCILVSRHFERGRTHLRLADDSDIPRADCVQRPGQSG